MTDYIKKRLSPVLVNICIRTILTNEETEFANQKALRTNGESEERHVNMIASFKRVWNKACYFCWLTCVSGLRRSCIVTELSLLLLSCVCFCCRLSRFLATCWLREVRRGSHSEPRLAGSYVFLSDSVAGDRILIMLLWRILWNVAQITTQIKTRNKIAAESYSTVERLYCAWWCFWSTRNHLRVVPSPYDTLSTVKHKRWTQWKDINAP